MPAFLSHVAKCSSFSDTVWQRGNPLLLCRWCKHFYFFTVLFLQWQPYTCSNAKPHYTFSINHKFIFGSKISPKCFFFLFFYHKETSVSVYILFPHFVHQQIQDQCSSNTLSQRYGINLALMATLSVMFCSLEVLMWLYDLLRQLQVGMEALFSIQLVMGCTLRHSARYDYRFDI